MPNSSSEDVAVEDEVDPDVLASAWQELDHPQPPPPLPQQSTSFNVKPNPTVRNPSQQSLDAKKFESFSSSALQTTSPRPLVATGTLRQQLLNPAVTKKKEEPQEQCSNDEDRLKKPTSSKSTSSMDVLLPPPPPKRKPWDRRSTSRGEMASAHQTTLQLTDSSRGMNAADDRLVTCADSAPSSTDDTKFHPFCYIQVRSSGYTFLTRLQL